MPVPDPFCEPTPTAPPVRHVLAAGQALRCHAARGTVIHVAEGGVEVVLPPQWAAVGTYSQHHRLSPGGVLVVSERGWLTIWAVRPATVMWQAPPVGRLARWAASLAVAMRRKVRGARLTSAASPVNAETR